MAANEDPTAGLLPCNCSHVGRLRTGRMKFRFETGVNNFLHPRLLSNPNQPSIEWE